MKLRVKIEKENFIYIYFLLENRTSQRIKNQKVLSFKFEAASGELISIN